ncbi:MAG: hypothetical protein U5P41_10525 [Gammaproteobacteria bacterium]|nr:hypothetical protein [Gammaproteobacteria bacterium]
MQYAILLHLFQVAAMLGAACQKQQQQGKGQHHTRDLAHPAYFTD